MLPTYIKFHLVMAMRVMSIKALNELKKDIDRIIMDRCDILLEAVHDDMAYIEPKVSAEERLIQETGLTLDDLPDGLPIEDFTDEDGNLDYDGISSW